ncbi:MAG: aldehyde ferredoxin oxidoreductase family protein [Syntrophales bacterium]|nr:aldehyde ferredoxin oxidoreductase family protein [Syntrophales bacterium]
MFGWCGKILRIDLTAEEFFIEEPEREVLHTYIGGRGLAGSYLAQEVTRDWNDPAMPLLLFAGPLVGTVSPASGRMTIMSRSPLTGTVGDTSAGGNFGTFLKKAGWDGILITGASTSLCGIEIADGAVVINHVPEFAGLTTEETVQYLADKGSTAVIGPAAERGVLFSNIIIDGHSAAGRNGIGLIFAAKNIKYISVRGTGKVPVHDPEELKRAREDIVRLTAASPVLLGELGISRYGTPALYDLMHTRNMMPTDNFRKTSFDDAPSMNAFNLHKTYKPLNAGCRGCHIRCKKITPKGSAIPEFESLSHFSALLNNSDLPSVVEANRICNELGMDTISAASTLACYSELEERTLTSREICKLLHDIGWGRGEIGIALGQGSARYAKSQGSPESSISVKGQELPAYDPRGAYGMALAYATSTRGGCHLRAYPVSHEILRKPVATDRFSWSGKSRIIKIAEDANAVVDSLAACKFIFFAASLEEYARAFTATTGVETSAQDLLKKGERIYYLERIMNSRNGFSSADDDLPPRFFSGHGSARNNASAKPLDRNDFLVARSNYYKIRGLDAKGAPTEKKAKELGLKWKS